MSGWLLFFGLALWGMALQAEESAQSQVVVRQAIQDFLEGQPPPPGAHHTESHIPPLDSRLSLPPCTLPLGVFWPGGARPGGSTTVGVRCEGEKSWTVYFPVKIKVFVEVLVATRGLPRGAILTAADVAVAQQEASRLQGDYLTVPDQVLGKSLGRSVAANQVLTASLLTTPLLIKRGNRVTLRVRSEGIEVVMAGIALSDAPRDGRVQVQNLSSKKVVEGIAVSADVVEIP